MENLALLRAKDELKIVLASRGDYEWARAIVREHPELPCPILFSPVHGALDGADLARWLVEDRLPVRLQVQLHKVLWPADMRGV
jgi:7-carboxy-7-deazaguanine synthase